MQYPKWQSWAWHAGLLPEAVTADRLILWLPMEQDGNSRTWQRIDNVPGAPVMEQAGLQATAATLLTARQTHLGFFGKLLRGTRATATTQSWMLPTGETAEQLGPRQTDLLLVWSADATPLDPSRLREHWPAAQRCQQLSEHLYVLTGVQPPPRPVPPVEETRAEQVENLSTDLPQDSARTLAERQLLAAQQAGDRRREAAALTDLGVLDQRQGEPQRALPRFEQALALARELGLRSLEIDILGNLGLAHLDIGQSGPAFEYLKQELHLAQQAENLFEEKMALDNLGILYGRLRDHRQAIAVYERAQHLAGDLGDPTHRADLLWFIAIQHAELGQREQALDKAQLALDLFQQLGNPQLGQLQAAVQQFREGDSASSSADGSQPAGANPLSGVYLGHSAGGSLQPLQAFAPGGTQQGPGLLRMALTAAHSFAKFVAAGFQTVNVSTYERRLQTCGSCEHHTGTRCLLCGCFTSVKARLPHEKCPLAKWDRAGGMTKHE